MPAELPTLLTQGGDTTDQSIYTTASVSPSAGKLQLLAICVRISGGTTNTPSISGCGLTWVLVDRVIAGTGSNNMFLFRATGSPSTGTISINFSGQTQQNCAWVLVEIGSVDIGNSGAAALVQHKPQYDGIVVATSMTITLNSFSNTANPTVGFIAVMFNSNSAITHGSGFTEIAQILSDDPTASCDLRLECQAKITNDTTVDWTFVNTLNASVMGIALELKFLTGGSSGGGQGSNGQNRGKGSGGTVGGKNNNNGKGKGGGLDSIERLSFVGGKSRRRIGIL